MNSKFQFSKTTKQTNNQTIRNRVEWEKKQRNQNNASEPFGNGVLEPPRFFRTLKNPLAKGQ